MYKKYIGLASMMVVISIVISITIFAQHLVDIQGTSENNILINTAPKNTADVTSTDSNSAFPTNAGTDLITADPNSTVANSSPPGSALSGNTTPPRNTAPGSTSQATSPPPAPTIDNSRYATDIATYQRVMPGAGFFKILLEKAKTSVPGVLFATQAQEPKGTPIGYAVIAYGYGFYPNDQIMVAVGLGLDRTIKKIVVLSPGTNPDAYPQSLYSTFIDTINIKSASYFTGKNAITASDADVVSGATYSCNGVFQAVKAALAQYPYR